MGKDGFLIRLDQLSSSYMVLLSLVLVGLLAGVLFYLGIIGWTVRLVGQFVRQSIRRGFKLWELLFSWATWDIFLTVVLSTLFLGWLTVRILPVLTILCASVPLLMGVTACLAYMFIDMERYAVARGYKAVHNPLKGQELAQHLVLYGHQVHVMLLIAASVGVIGGFALLNFGLYSTIGHGWYKVAEDQPDATFADFLANALITLLRIVDILDFMNSSHLVGVTYVKQAKWPANALLSVFKMFFTVVLLQQIFACIRQGSLLSETISDLWNPHEPIHERARNALPQYGPAAVGPLLVSLGSITSLTREQRDQIPLILAAIGPGAIPALTRHLHDPHDHVRAIAVATLGHLHAYRSIHQIANLGQDPSDAVRQSAVEALGWIAAADHPTERKANSDRLRPTSRAITNWRLFKWRARHRLHNPEIASVSDPIKLAVRTLQSALSDELPTVRMQAARALGRIGILAAASAFPLIATLRDEHEVVRLEATKALGLIGGPKTATVNALIEMLGDVSTAVKAAAAQALGSQEHNGARAVPTLVPLLQDRDETVRNAVAEAIGQIGPLNEATAKQLVQGLTSPDNVVRAQTAEALGMIGAPAQETAQALVDALKDGTDLVRAKAVEALGKIGPTAAPVAVPQLIRALQDRDNSVCSLAAAALGQMGDAAHAAIPQLITALGHINPGVRARAAEALGKLSADSDFTRQGLHAACHDEDSEVRIQALRSLGIIGSPQGKTQQTVLQALQDPDGQVRSAAVDALGAWGRLDEISVTQLLELLDDPSDQVKTEVARVIPQCAGDATRVVDSLARKVLEESSSIVQLQAAWALAEIGPAAASASSALITVSQTAELCVREQALRAISRIQPADGWPVLLAALKDPHSEIRKVAASGLTLFPEIAIENATEIIDALNDPELEVRRYALQLIARFDPLPEAAIPLLLNLADEPGVELSSIATNLLKRVPNTTVDTVLEHIEEEIAIENNQTAGPDS